MAEEGGVLYIYRLDAYPRSRTSGILIDGNKIMDPPEKAYTWLHLPAGTHTVTVDWSWDTGWPDLAFEIPIDAGTEHFLKITGSFEDLGLIWRLG